MTDYKIPIRNVPQEFEITLGNRNLRLINKWNYLMSTWTLDIFDNDTDVALIYSVPLIVGVNLLEQFDYLGLGGKLFVFTEGDESENPDYESLGETSNLFFRTED